MKIFSLLATVHISTFYKKRKMILIALFGHYAWKQVTWFKNSAKNKKNENAQAMNKKLKDNREKEKKNVKCAQEIIKTSHKLQ